MTRRPPVTALGAAKINIGWRVGARRDDGYHDVTGLIQTVSLYDRLDVTAGVEGDGGVVVDVADEPLRLIVAGRPELEREDNLVVTAARVLAEERAPVPATIRLEKAIPVAAGLGGGSADAAAALTALNLVWGAGCAPARLIELGSRIGSDVAPILAGGLVHVSGRGERVRCIGSATAGAFVLGISSEGVSAADAYARFDETDHAKGTGAWHHNDLEAAAIELVPALAARLDAMRGAGADPVFVAGSGPTVVGVTASEHDARDVAERVRSVLARVEVVTPQPWGVRLSVGGGDVRP